MFLKSHTAAALRPSTSWTAVFSASTLMLLVTGLAGGQVILQPRPGEPIAGLSAEQLARFEQGRLLFEQALSPAQGLGPIFNQASCGACHNTPATGGAGTISVTRFGLQAQGGAFDPLLGLGGSLLQAQAIDDLCQETVPTVANVIATRITPPIFGAGLVEAIPDAAILALQTNGGIAHWVPRLEDPGGPLRVGRFGWKSQVATVLTFTADAAANEMGLTSSLVPFENAPNGNLALLAQCDLVADPEDGPGPGGATFVARVADFQRFLAPPPQTPRSGMTGETLFVAIGCANCHRNTAYVTGSAPESVLTGISIRPYSDFLLHDMGSLGDGIVQGAAPVTWMRTAPLWGLRHRDPWLHDGSAAGGTFSQRVGQAVAAHDGEAAPARDAFTALSANDRQAVVAFLASLGHEEFDMVVDSRIDELDFDAFFACFQAGGAYGPDDPCAVADVDQNGNVDQDDFVHFLQVYQGPFLDCDGNAIHDLLQLIVGTGNDCNGNRVLDACELGQGAPDVNGNGILDECEPFVQHLIWCAEGAGGANDSCAALTGALAAQGQDYAMRTSLAQLLAQLDLLEEGGILWVLLGTFPANHPLTAAEGATLANLAANGQAIYIEGTDIWGFDPATAFDARDGVEDTTVNDGDDSLDDLTGAAFARVDLTDLSALAYFHDTAANEWTDRILPTGTTPGAPIDLGGPNAGVIWRNAPDAGETSYPVATFYLPNAPHGPVLCQSWELAGFGGDLAVLIALYVAALSPEPPPPEPEFQRGNCNGDLATDIADPISLVTFLFASGPHPACADACDANDDGSLNIADAVHALGALFLGGVFLPPPSPGCGPDPTNDGLDCTTNPCP